MCKNQDFLFIMYSGNGVQVQSSYVMNFHQMYILTYKLNDLDALMRALLFFNPT